MLLRSENREACVKVEKRKWMIQSDFIYLSVSQEKRLLDAQVHPSRELVASGQKAGRHRKAQPHVRIWSTETLLTLYVFGMTEFQMGVSALAFSQLVKYPIIMVLSMT